MNEGRKPQGQELASPRLTITTLCQVVAELQTDIRHYSELNREQRTIIKKLKDKIQRGYNLRKAEHAAMTELEEKILEIADLPFSNNLIGDLDEFAKELETLRETDAVIDEYNSLANTVARAIGDDKKDDWDDDKGLDIRCDYEKCKLLPRRLIGYMGALIMRNKTQYTPVTIGPKVAEKFGTLAGELSDKVLETAAKIDTVIPETPKLWEELKEGDEIVLLRDYGTAKKGDVLTLNHLDEDGEWRYVGPYSVPMDSAIYYAYFFNKDWKDLKKGDKIVNVWGYGICTFTHTVDNNIHFTYMNNGKQDVCNVVKESYANYFLEKSIK